MSAQTKTTPSLPSPSLSPEFQLRPQLASTFNITHHTSTTLPEPYLHACFNLVETTSKAAYIASSKGWSKRAKMREMRQKSMEWVIVTRKGVVDETVGDIGADGKKLEQLGNKKEGTIETVTAVDNGDGSRHAEDEDALETSLVSGSAMQETYLKTMPSSNPPQASKKRKHNSHANTTTSIPTTPLTAFLSYTHTLEPNPPSPSLIPTLYIYELHVSPHSQNLGLGRSLMALAEEIARKVGDEMVMLTVFVGNVEGRRFYERLEFELWDEEVVGTDVDSGGNRAVEEVGGEDGERVGKRRKLRSGKVFGPGLATGYGSGSGHANGDEERSKENRGPTYVILAKKLNSRHTDEDVAQLTREP